MASDDAEWLVTHPARAVGDFFDLFDDSSAAVAQCARELERRGGPLSEGGVEQLTAELRAHMRAARARDWRPFEHHLQRLGASYAGAGLAFSAWSDLTGTFYALVVPRAVEVHGGDSGRLVAVLLVLGDYLKRSLAAIADGYRAAQDQRERAVAAEHSAMIDAVTDAVIDLAADGLVSDLNPAAERMFGYRKVDAIGRALEHLVIPARFRAGLGRPRFNGAETRLGERVELTAMRADGSELSVALTLVAADAGRGQRGFVGILRDLGADRSTEESLALRDHALEQAQFGIVVSDPATREITNVNPAYARMVGYDASALIGSNGAQLIAPASQPMIPEIGRALRTRGHHTYELQLRRQDGSIMLAFASSSTIRTRSGALMTISTVIDISERSELERTRALAKHALEHNAERLGLLSRTAHEFAAASGNIEQLLELVARRLGEIIGDGCAVRLISDDGAWLEPSASFYHRDAESRELARQVLGTKRQRVGDGIAGRVAASGVGVLMPVIDGAQLVALTPPAFVDVLGRVGVSSVLSVPLRSRGRTTGAISLLRSRPGHPYTIEDQHFAQDLADRAGLAIDNAVLVATLEQRVAERTAALETANHDLEAFSYSVSHDLRTPLRAIDGFSEILVSDYAALLDPVARDYLQRIRVGAQRMSSLIDDLLNLARISRVALTRSELDLSALAAEVAAEITKREPARTTPIHIAPGLRARADARLLRIVLSNLLENAWKFTGKHERAEIWFGETAGTFHVRDTGAGFDMAYAAKLFGAFQRLHSANDYPGTGVGLATVQRIITHHGGTIWAEGEVDRGAVFYFTL